MTGHRKQDGRLCCTQPLPEQNYSFMFRPGPEIAYHDHQPFSLGDVWRALEGVGMVRIISPTSRVVAVRGYGGWEYVLPDGTHVDRLGLRRHLNACRQRSRTIHQHQEEAA
jgi:hypothetical protein